MPSGIVSVTMGVMNPLLGKLTNLLGEEYKKLTGVGKQVAFLKDEFSAMKALLDKMELMDKLDPSAKNWRDHVREMSYDMENFIGDFMHDIEGTNAKAGFIKKMAKRLRRLGRHHQIANRIEELKVLAEEANARRKRYNIDDCVDLSLGVVAIDPRMSAIYKEATGLVGIDGPTEEVVSVLMDSQKKLKVVSIVGFGGLGKTTLAKKVYDEIGGKFYCKAFVSVSQRPDVKNLLSGLQRKFGMEESSHAHDLQEIIDRLREYLKQKRYVVVVDDLWDQSSWNIIRCAFPENSNESRVMVTTRLDDVALSACQHDRACIYRMKTLKEQDSQRLFFKRVFGSENICPLQFKEVSAEILKKCGGLPLAIITIASLLANHEARSLNEWKSIKNSLGAKLATETTLEEMRGILNLSYMHLPVILRPCFLYLGMYPEDREIMRDDLVHQWIAEGFVCGLQGVDIDDVAISYFNELINRIHDMLLDLILRKSTDDNFISVTYNYEDMEKLHSSEHKVRRLSLKSSLGGATSETLATSMSQVRSYAQFGESKYTPPISQFKYLRVLLFNFPDKWVMTVDLTAIGHLFLLRYLRVLAESAEVAHPAKIQGLVHIETLELVCNSGKSFPSDIIRLANLFHLRLPNDVVLPVGIQNMKSLRTLHCSGISGSSLEDIKSLSELENLKKLVLSTFDGQRWTVDCVYAMVSSIGMLRDLKHFDLYSWTESDVSDSLLDSLPDPPPCLEVLNLQSWTFSRFPKSIGELRCLRILSLRVLRLSSDDICVLGEFSSLFSVYLHVSEVVQDKAVVRTGLFPVLEVLQLWSYKNVSACLCFEAGTMPKLQKLDLGFGLKEWSGATPVGMECLPCLQNINVYFHGAGKTCEDVSAELGENWMKDITVAVESAFESALHPKHPSVSVIYYSEC
ncbi:unnamed protein product [Alopecurus aequalis]